MPEPCRIAVVSDIHYASAAEQARGNDFELRGIGNPLLRLLVRMHRRFIWLHRPLEQNYLLDTFLAGTAGCDGAIANGDYSCNSACVGVSDPATRASAGECLSKLRRRFGSRFHAVFGDHELGKVSFFGGRGGMRLASWLAAQEELALEPIWQFEIGRYTLLGCTSSLVALPVYASDTLPEEYPEWDQLRREHLDRLAAAFTGLSANRRVILFCHDPSALPFLCREPSVAARINQIDLTILGHLHSPFVLKMARRLAGIPRISFLGYTARRLTSALREARHWEGFHVRLCPSLAGIELFKDGGYLTLDVAPDASSPVEVRFHPVSRKAPERS